MALGLGNIFDSLIKTFFYVQTDPYNKEISKLRVFIVVSVLVVISIFLLIQSFYNPIGQFEALERDKQRIEDLKMLEKAILDYQLANNKLPPNLQNGEYRIGGNDSPSSSEDNWLGVNFVSLETIPTDPLYLKSSTAPYPYRYKTNGASFKLDAFLETNPNNLMQSDGGLLNAIGAPTNNLARYEVGTDLSIRF
ncbi:MAG TPA: hypothetical protein VIK81_03690 [Patescibacteria group bacterium]